MPLLGEIWKLNVSLSRFFFLTFPLCTALQQEVADAESQGDLALHLPPCNANADKREDVYPFDERIFYSCAGGGMCLWK